MESPERATATRCAPTGHGIGRQDRRTETLLREGPAPGASVGGTGPVCEIGGWALLSWEVLEGVFYLRAGGALWMHRAHMCSSSSDRWVHLGVHRGDVERFRRSGKCHPSVFMTPTGGSHCSGSFRFGKGEASRNWDQRNLVCV